MENDAVIIEVGINESTSRGQHPDVPITPQECADVGARCRDAGAAVVHWHARDPETGAQRLDDIPLHLEAFAALHDADVLAYPSYPIDAGNGDRLAHCWALHEQLGLEMAPTDLGSVNLALWDGRERKLVGVDAMGESGVVVNPTSFVNASVRRMHASSVIPSLGSFDTAHTRTVGHMVDAGILREPVFLKLFLLGAWVAGPLPTTEAIDFHLAQLPAGIDIEWVVVPYLIDEAAVVERLCRHALERGGGIRVGIGDNPLAHPDDDNVRLVEQATEWASEAGRRPATADDVRTRFAPLRTG